MISERQHEANRRNAAKSHGPITPEGRAAVRHNALKHGFTAAEIIFPAVEDQIDFEQFRAAFEEELQPVGPTEEVLVEDIVVSRWREAQAHLALIVRDDAQSSDTLGKMSRYEGRFERTFYKALKELQRLQVLRSACPILGMGLFRKIRFQSIPHRPPHSPKRQRGEWNPRKILFRPSRQPIFPSLRCKPKLNP